MRKIWLAVLFLVLSFFTRSAFPQSFTTPPYNVPYQYGDTTFSWITQVQVDSNKSYVFYCKNTAGEPTIDWNDSTQFYLRFGGEYGWYQGGYCRAFITTTGGSSWYDVVVDGYYILSNTEIFSLTQIRSHREFKYNGYPYNGYTNANFGVSGINTGDILIPGSSFSGGPILMYLSFPFANLTAYTAPVSAVMDHTMTAPYNADTDLRVTAFNGEMGTVGPFGRSTCYAKPDGSIFLAGSLNYTGARSGGGKAFLCYNGHPGYDYPQPQGTNIFAPANGKLCVATIRTTPQSPANVWRNPTECGAIPDVVTTKWKNIGGYNTFYIFHREYINGSTDTYLTVFLHSNNLESLVWSTIASQGYASVTRGQHIADVGDIGATERAYHLHLEVYKQVNGVWSRVDPYGDGVNGILW